jgi:hypothetical protein
MGKTGEKIKEVSDKITIEFGKFKAMVGVNNLVLILFVLFFLVYLLLCGFVLDLGFMSCNKTPIEIKYERRN